MSESDAESVTAKDEVENEVAKTTSFTQIGCFCCLQTTYDGRRLKRINGKNCMEQKLRPKLERIYRIGGNEFDIRVENLLKLNAGICRKCGRRLDTACEFIDMMIPSTEAFLKQNIQLPEPVTKTVVNDAKLKVSLLGSKINEKDVALRFSTVLIKLASELFNNKLYSDLTVLLENGENLYAHKFILASRSKYWGISDFDYTNELDLSEKNTDLVFALFRWVYQDELSHFFSSEFLKDLYLLAKELKITPLMRRCQRALMSFLTINNCLKYYVLAEDLSAEILKEFCVEFMRRNKLEISIIDKKTMKKESNVIIAKDTLKYRPIVPKPVMQVGYQLPIQTDENKVSVRCLKPSPNTEGKLPLPPLPKLPPKKFTAKSKDGDSSEPTDANSDIHEQVLGEVQDLGQLMKNIAAFEDEDESTTYEKNGDHSYGVSKMNDDDDDDYYEDQEFDTGDDDTENDPDYIDGKRKSPRKKKNDLNQDHDHDYFNIPFSARNEQYDGSKFNYDACKKDMEDYKESLKMLTAFVSIAIPDEAGAKPYTCLVCDQSFYFKCELQRHMKVHFGKDPFKCLLCEKKFSTIHRLEYHCRVHTGIKPYQCDQCERTFNYEFQLKNHKLVHTGRQQMQCEICGKYYTCLKSLKRHQFYHLNDEDKPYQCETCGKGFTCANYFKIHQRSHTGEKPYQCDTCGKAFAHSSTYHHHVKIHQKQKNFVCGVCGLAFTSQYYLQTHMVEHSGEEPLHSDVCQHAFFSKKGLTSHMARKHPEEVMKEDQMESYDGERDLLKYLETHVERLINPADLKTYKCLVCEKAYKDYYDIKIHMMAHSGIKPYKCDMCPESFCKRSVLALHKMKHTGEKPHSCDVCGESYITKNLLKLHMSKHTGVKPYKCKVCLEAFSSYRQLGNHIRRHAANQDYMKDEYLALNDGKATRESLKNYVESKIKEHNHVCDICGKSYHERFSLKIHMRTHTKEKPYKCDTCGKGFTSSTNRRRHRMTHTGDKQFKCPFCELCFYVRADLNKHKKTHSSERPFQCEECGKAFKTKSTLRDHIKFHIGAKPFKCDLCDKAFVLKTCLTTHRRTHTGEKPFECTICFRKFSDNRSRKKHEATHGSNMNNMNNTAMINETLYQLPPQPQQNISPQLMPLQHHRPMPMHHPPHSLPHQMIPPLPASLPHPIPQRMQPIQHHRMPVHQPNSISIDGVEINQAVSFIELGTYHQL